MFVFAATSVYAAAPSEEGAGEIADPHQPRLRFFYYDAPSVEWIVSSDKKAFAVHLRQNEESSTFVTTIHNAVTGDELNDVARTQMTDWIAAQRETFEQRRRDTISFRKAEGIVAYLRAYDFSIRRLVEALKDLSGATNVELVAIHRTAAQTEPDFKIKVVLTDAAVDLGRQGMNVDMQSATSGYVPVVYALGMALYDLQEIVNADQPAEQPPARLEELPEPVQIVVERPQIEIEAAIEDFD